MPPRNRPSNFLTHYQTEPRSSRPSTVASYVRDPDDDYLIAHGLMFDVDYIVTGDMAVRLLSQVGNLRIVTPAEFIDVLEHSNLI